jgi:hypothetical protein
MNPDEFRKGFYRAAEGSFDIPLICDMLCEEQDLHFDRLL